MTTLRVLTIGHSNHSLVVFLELLKRNGVTAIADVRSTPYSKFAPQFCKEPLCASLGEHGISYAFLGRELGARSTDPTCYEDGRVVYARLAQTDLFHDGLDRALRGAQSDQVALMCTEKDPLDCHRTLLIARALIGRGVEVDHILVNGDFESHHCTMLRLLDRLGESQLDFFSTMDEQIDAAAKQQEARIAYVDKLFVSSPGGRE